MARVAPTVFVLALLAATVVAFVRSEQLKLEKSPIVAPDIDKTFSPVCECSQRVARIAFSLRKRANATVHVIDADGDRVRALATRKRFPTRRISLVWDGRGDDARFVPDGVYRVRIELGPRTIVPPNQIRLDTRAPKVKWTHVSRPVLSPDGDGRFDAVRLRYESDERARAAMYVGAQRFERKKRRDEGGEFRWNGRLRGRTLPAGLYALAVAVRDDAGNLSARDVVRVRIRYIELAKNVIRVGAGRRFGIRVRTDARRFSWHLGRRMGGASPGLLVLRAPTARGRYALVVTTSGHAARARVVVRR